MKSNFLQKQTSRREMLRIQPVRGRPLLAATFFSPAPRLRSGRRATSAFGGRPAREYARQVQRRSPRNTKAC